MWKLTRISSLQETKSLASYPLRKNPQSLVSKKMKMKKKEKQSKALYILYMIYDDVYSGCKGIYIETFFQPS